MKNRRPNHHLSAERLQAFLDGELSRREILRAEEHFAVCPRCSEERDTWRALFEDLAALTSHGPHEGFAGRVMASVRRAEELPFAARVRGRSSRPAHLSGHLGETVLQDFLDGELGRRQVARVQAHLEDCAVCSAEADLGLALLRRLEAVRRFAPSDGFSDRVMAEVRLPEALPLVARVRARMAALLPAASGHVEPRLLQDFIDGALPARGMARVSAHVDACSSCAVEAAGWRNLVTGLEALEGFAPSRGFAERVMDRVRMPAPATASVSPWTRALTALARAVPRTRRAWATISGVAVTPAVTAGLVFYAVFSHPTITLEALASFVWWQVADLGAAGWMALSTTVLNSTRLFGADALFETLASAPLAVAGGVLVYSMASVLALRVLYKNLISNRPTDGRYAHVIAS